jgi:hypothetical protein
MPSTVGARGVLLGAVALAACAYVVLRPVAWPTSSRGRPLTRGTVSSVRPAIPLPPGTVVPAASLGAGLFADARHGFTLASIDGTETYPAATVDGGRTWRIDGPLLPTAASAGSGVVSQPGIAGPRTYFVSEGIGGITVVEVTTDAGKRWWQTLLPGGAVFVGAFDGELTAIVAGGASRPGVQETFLAYHSRTGRRWTYDDSLDADS